MKQLIIILLLFLTIDTEVTYSVRPIKIDRPVQIDYDSCYNYAIRIIKKYEVYKAEKYCLFGEYYQGYGHSVSKNSKSEIWSEQKADSVLRNDLNKFINTINKLDSTIPENRKLLLAMICFNCKHKNFKNSRIFQLIQHDCPYKMVQKTYYDYCHVNGKFHKGLLKRRIDEFKIY